jgi:hypothetical protein
VPGALIAVTFRITAHVGQIGGIQVGLKTDLAVLTFELHDVIFIIGIFYIKTLAATDGTGHGTSSPADERSEKTLPTTGVRIPNTGDGHTTEMSAIH